MDAYYNMAKVIEILRCAHLHYDIKYSDQFGSAPKGKSRVSQHPSPSLKSTAVGKYITDHIENNPTDVQCSGLSSTALHQKKKLFAYKTKMLTTWIISYKTEQQTHIVSTVTH